jgi:penicillin-binding protein 1B
VRVTYDEIPRSLRDAIVAIEDRRFFDHGGVNYLRLAAAAMNDIRTGQYLHGAGGSTLTMQFAKGFFLTSDKTPTRKWAQILIALQLENRLTKQEILAAYVNWAPMGQRGSFEIAGMGEASQIYFGKDVKDLDLEECALLAAIVQRPSFLTPFRHPERALQRRNLVLDAMAETGAIRREEADRAKAVPLKLATADTDANDAPYFVDMVRDELLADYDEEQLDQDGMRVYTTIDPALQKAAAEAVRAGMSQVDELIRRQRTRKVKVGEGQVGASKNSDAHMERRTLAGPQAQVALIAMDPHTGKVLALVGGRNYGASQLNHALAERPTGSIFKPLVYAAALNAALRQEAPAQQQEDRATTNQEDRASARQEDRAPGHQEEPSLARAACGTADSVCASTNQGLVSQPPASGANTANQAAFTQATIIDDVQSAFQFGNQIYTPRNYHDVYYGKVTARFALAHSLNNATVKLAEMVGYDQVAELAKTVGIESVKPTPAMALGAYEASPLDMARAYTAFANAGTLVSPIKVVAIRDAQGNVLENIEGEKKPVLDPRVAYVATNMMEAVMSGDGTGAGVRGMGFTAPAAGKTGTSHDGWFAGYTDNLLCIVWVGFDDYSDLKLEGAHSAAPIWAMFMKKAVALPDYRETKPFVAPPGVVVCEGSAFVAGTERCGTSN